MDVEMCDKPTHELWFVQTALGRYINIKSRILCKENDIPPEGFYEWIAIATSVAEATDSEVFCRYVEAATEDEAWDKIMNLEVQK